MAFKILKYAKYIVLILFFCGISFTLSAQQPVKLGKVTHSVISEISGIIPYSYAKGYFWVNNDSGDGPYIYLIDSLAKLRVKVEIEGVNAIDVEDIARFRMNNENYLLIADMGNNLRDREVLSLYVVKEPKVAIGAEIKTVKIQLEKEVKFKYADKRRDAEALFVDPIDNKVYILSKRDFESTIFSFPLQLNDNSVQVLQPQHSLTFTFTTAADISPDGKYIVAKNLSQVYFWERNAGETILQTLKKTPKNIPYVVEPQGEAICFDLDNRFLYTISERPFGLDSYLYRYDF